MINSEVVLGLPYFEVTDISDSQGSVCIAARFVGKVACPNCGGESLRSKGLGSRCLRHESWGIRRCELRLETRKWCCKSCGRSFWQRFPGILPRRRATEAFRRSVSTRHWDGISRSRLGEREHVGSATVERWFHDHLKLKSKERSPLCPRVLGIDEHFFSRRQGFATTFCDLKAHNVFDVVLGRSEASLESYLGHLKGKELVEVVCMDLSTTYRAVAKKHFPNARIVADRFHVIRLVNHHFLTCWKQIDPLGAKSRGLLSLMRRHKRNLKDTQQAGRLQAYLDTFPGLAAIYDFKQSLCDLLLERHCSHRGSRGLVRRLLRAIEDLLNSKLEPLVSLGQTLRAWQEEIATMFRFTKNNGITEGFHNKMETLSRQAYGFKNFENYRLRVRVMCS